MTVMPSSSDVADKAVSTEDASSGVEVARLEAVLAALVETKVEAMKASTAAATRSGSAPASPRRPRLTSSSTASSSQNNNPSHHHHHHHHHHRHHQQHQHRHRHDNEKRHGHHHKHRRHDSAPCGDYIEDPITHRHKQRHGKGKQKMTDSPSGGKKRRRHSRSPQLQSSAGLDSRFELLASTDVAVAEQDYAFVNFDRMREALSDSCDYPRLHQSACYISHSTAQLKSHYDEEDYLSFNFADDVEEDETFSGLHEAMALPHVKSPKSARDHRFHRPRKKRKHRKRKQQHLVDEVEVELGVDPDDLPPRARWTIVATACLLLAMSLLLVGVTLRMAPIIDEMVRKENEELLNSLNRESTLDNATSLQP